MSVQTSSAGSFVLETSEFRLSHLIFQLNHRKSSAKLIGRPPFLVRVPRDLLALNVRISQPRKSESSGLRYLNILKKNFVPAVLGKPQSLTVILFTGRNHIQKASVKLSSPFEKTSVIFRCGEAILENGEHLPCNLKFGPHWN